MSSRSHVLILPYYCQAEVDRYLRIADSLQRLGPQPIDYEFLLAASPKIEINHVLHDRFAKLAPTTSFACPTQVFGYPQGPTAMFWDCMDYIAEYMNHAPGFSLWLESDMAIVKADWLIRLDAEWARETGDRPPLIMGNVVPDVYRRRFFRRPKLLLTQHVNGGACYAKDFSRHMVPAARHGVFDMAVYQYAHALNAVRHTDLICFSTVESARRDVLDSGKVVLHGFMQDKDQFIARCTAPRSPSDDLRARLVPLATRWEMVRRKIRSHIVRRGSQAVLNNVLLTQQQVRAASRRAA